MKRSTCLKTTFDLIMKAFAPSHLRLIFFIGMGFASIAQASEPASPSSPTVPLSSSNKSSPWLGLEVTRADATVRAQLPKLPQGVGFVINHITPQGPADQAGIRSLDVLWKWNDQWLINEAQLATLLNLQQVGDRINVTVYRAGKEHTFEITLGSSPISPRAALSSPMPQPRTIAADAPMALQKSLPDNSRIARLEDAQAVLEMEKRDDGIWLSIIDTEGVTIFDGPYTSSAKSVIPLAWHDRLDALQRSLQKKQSPTAEPHSANRRTVPTLPQPRMSDAP